MNNNENHSGGNRPPRSGFQKKTFDARKPGFGRPARPAGDSKPAYGRPARPAGDSKPAFGRPARPAGDSKPAYGRPARPAGDSKPAFARPARPAGDGKPAFARPARPAGEGKPAFGRPARPAGDSKPAFARPARPADEGKPAYGRSADPVAPRPVPEGKTARYVAMQAFADIVRKDAFASQAIDDQLKGANLTQLDKRFCTALTYLTIENLTAIDFALSFFLKDAEGLEERVHDILRISVCQLLFMDKVPENAIADEAVKLTRRIGMEPLTGLVNSVLRSMMREPENIKWPSEDEGARYLSVRYSMPEWLVQKLIDAYGTELAADIVKFRKREHYMTLRPNMTRLSDEAFEELLQKKVWASERGLVPHAWRVRDVSEVARDVDYLGGAFSIQGESSILCAQMASVRPGMQVLDCCAAPGGKTAYMAEVMNGSGRVYAWDVHDHRVALLKAMQYRLKLDNVRSAVRDARVFKEDMEHTCDVVLLDAPCSGLGVMDDKPDIKYRATPQSLEELTHTQHELLNVCCRYVKLGGVLVYSTCSILPEENEEQVKRFLAAHPDFVLDAPPQGIDERFAARQGAFGMQLLECRDQVEGFFIARLKRVKYS